MQGDEGEDDEDEDGEWGYVKTRNWVWRPIWPVLVTFAVSPGQKPT